METLAEFGEWNTIRQYFTQQNPLIFWIQLSINYGTYVKIMLDLVLLKVSSIQATFKPPCSKSKEYCLTPVSMQTIDLSCWMNQKRIEEIIISS